MNDSHLLHTIPILSIIEISPLCSEKLPYCTNICLFSSIFRCSWNSPSPSISKFTDIRLPTAQTWSRASAGVTLCYMSLDESNNPLYRQCVMQSTTNGSNSLSFFSPCRGKRAGQGIYLNGFLPKYTVVPTGKRGQRAGREGRICKASDRARCI